MGLVWQDYLNQNRTAGDCQLVTAVNAAHYLTGRVVSDEEYEELVDLTRCRHGSAICIREAWTRLGICEGERFDQWPDLSTPGLLMPLEINVWHKFYGFHSILAIDYSPETEAFRVTNFRHVATCNGWVFQEDLQHFIEENPDKSEPRWRLRSYKVGS
jgi:hypothetical protein